MQPKNLKKSFTLGLSAVVVTSSLVVPQTTLANKEDVGTLIGGVVGAIIGSQAGSDKNQERNAFIGAIIGGVIGNRIGADMDERDRQALAEAQRRALESENEQEQITWQGSDYGSRTGARGSITTIRSGTHRRTNQLCREYESVITTRRATERVRGIACLNNRGQWYEVQSREVTFENLDQGASLPAPLPAAGGVLPGADTLGPVPPGYRNAMANSAEVNIVSISRRNGGEFIEIELDGRTQLDRIDLQVLSGNLKVHRTLLHSTRGQIFTSSQLRGLQRLQRGEVVSSEQLRGVGSIRKIQIQVESMGSTADMRIFLFNRSEKVQMRNVQRNNVQKL
ncbi:MAG: RT0821/Lpp0805 family surface protein [Bdellovibrionia bacterium]